MPSNPDAPNDPAVAPELDEETPVTRPASLEDVLEAAAGGDAAGVDGVRQREVVQESDYEQSLHSERERQAEHDREVDR